MECCYEQVNTGESDPGRSIIVRHTFYQPKSSPWLDLRVFYVRVSNFEVDESTPEHLTLHHIPLSPDTLLEVNGGRSSIYSEGVSSLLRRDRVDKKSEEATFVSTDSIRVKGSVRFEVYDREDLLLSGILEMCNGGNGFIGESKNHKQRWSMNCQSEMTIVTGFLRGKLHTGSELPLPTVEVYVAGCFSGSPIILTKTLQLSLRRKHPRKGMLDSIPEYETTECKKDASSDLSLQVSEFQDYKQENDEDYSNLYTRAEYIEGEDGELSWFNAGVRVGVGIGLGVCLGIGIGVGLLVRTYQATTRNFKRRLV
eukprot:TRINITY_DN1985_c0_g1_i1.p1 TRINITY_DN1985_c0_g1~~TRINITY_DN1985_c0_g1_i1.p1  ORF type:complete len:311 (-),score=37.29 TRINITY_DN1985_c0_g1_i1:242-1174(-)